MPLAQSLAAALGLSTLRKSYYVLSDQEKLDGVLF